MNIIQWLEAEKGRSAALAAHTGRTAAAVSQWKDNGVPPRLMKTVRDFTAGAVTLEEMLPDASTATATESEITPELVTAEGVPPISDLPANLPSGEPQKVGRKGRAANDLVVIERAAQGV